MLQCAAMHADPHGQDNALKHPASYHRLFSLAFDLLSSEFVRAFHSSPYYKVPTPYGANDDELLIDLVIQMLDAEQDNHTLIELLHVCAHAAGSGDQQARDVIERLSRMHASSCCMHMSEMGDFNEEE